ncbi:hypothetical protein CEXT_45441 [Caerostris extrusa]|uniref:Uncharacterized protein n=1 Tax=Caerostris extrusa TaxID=172846 RepID=A0AAV4VMG1_CAEEX|nr:hypothetical protein CEXT_45441 [Caerostris extrusa]
MEVVVKGKLQISAVITIISTKLPKFEENHLKCGEVRCTILLSHMSPYRPRYEIRHKLPEKLHACIYCYDPYLMDVRDTYPSSNWMRKDPGLLEQDHLLGTERKPASIDFRESQRYRHL